MTACSTEISTSEQRVRERRVRGHRKRLFSFTVGSGFAIARRGLADAVVPPVGIRHFRRSSSRLNLLIMFLYFI